MLVEHGLKQLARLGALAHQVLASVLQESMNDFRAGGLGTSKTLTLRAFYRTLPADQYPHLVELADELTSRTATDSDKLPLLLAVLQTTGMLAAERLSPSSTCVAAFGELGSAREHAALGAELVPTVDWQQATRGEERIGLLLLAETLAVMCGKPLGAGAKLIALSVIRRPRIEIRWLPVVTKL